ncbi:hypothetical protein [Conexibacter sp. W3-3-2]|uniref:hypothetical protein n=1 Tax=Conexibacter sp. W3-3-2 TaxID=2675227 RepID=UPI001E5415F3|nr:hypothetical protein [Conexibacter sp. W3-3-2]
MTVLVLVASGGLLITSAALVEVFRQLAEIRRTLDLDDSPMALEFQERDLREAPVDLPPDMLEGHHGLVFLHATCGTCRLVAEAYASAPDRRAIFVIPSEDVDATPAFRRLAETSQVFADSDEALAGFLGMDVAPSVVGVEDGRAVGAVGISTVRQVKTALPQATAPRQESHHVG